MGLGEKIFGTHSDKELKRIYPIVDKIVALVESMQKLSDEELKAKTDEFKERLKKGETLDDILVEAFATVREAAFRVLGMKHFRVQLVGGVLLHQGRIAEMRTGEGKTLVSTLPAYLNALEGKGVHVVTVNDYLAKRDAEWMGSVHRFLGLTVGVILNSDSNDDRREAYKCDITYITNNELGFDYLRDNMVIYKERLVQKDFITVSSMRSTLSLSMRHVHRSSFPDRAESLQIYTRCAITSQEEWREVPPQPRSANLMRSWELRFRRTATIL